MKRNPKQQPSGKESSQIQATQGENQGEGDRKSANRYNKDTQEFVKQGKVEQATREAAGQDPEEARRAEEAGRERAKEVDPAVHRDYRKPGK